MPMCNVEHKMLNGEPYRAKGNGNGYVLSCGGRNVSFASDLKSAWIEVRLLDWYSNGAPAQ